MGCVCVFISRKWRNAIGGNMVTRKQEKILGMKNALFPFAFLAAKL